MSNNLQFTEKFIKTTSNIQKTSTVRTSSATEEDDTIKKQEKGFSMTKADDEKENLYKVIQGSAVTDSKSVASSKNSFIIMYSIYICTLLLNNLYII